MKVVRRPKIYAFVSCWHLGRGNTSTLHWKEIRCVGMSNTRPSNIEADIITSLANFLFEAIRSMQSAYLPFASCCSCSCLNPLFEQFFRTMRWKRLSDHAIGPALQDCQPDFDLTLSFDFIASAHAIAGMVGLGTSRTSSKVTLNLRKIMSFVYSISQETHEDKPPSKALSVIVILNLDALSLSEHLRSPRSSDRVNTYLFFSIAFDALQVWTLWLQFNLELGATPSTCLSIYPLEKYHALAPDIAIPILHRIAIICFRYTRPALFQAIVAIMKESAFGCCRNDGRCIISATSLLYFTLTVSIAYYQYKNYTVVTELPRALDYLLFAETLASQHDNFNGTAPITPMRVDVDGATAAVSTMNNLWTGFTEICVVLSDLKHQIGSICIVSVVCCVDLSGNRVKTSHNIAHLIPTRIIKSIKLMGSMKYMLTDLQVLRDLKIHKSNPRKLTECVVANLPDFSAPVITFAVFAALPQSQISISKAFASLPLIPLIEQFSISFIASLQGLAAFLSCLSRLERSLESAHLAPRNEKLSTRQKFFIGKPSLMYRITPRRRDSPQPQSKGPAKCLQRPSHYLDKEVASPMFVFRVLLTRLWYFHSTFIHHAFSVPGKQRFTIKDIELTVEIPSFIILASLQDPIAVHYWTPWFCNRATRGMIIGEMEHDAQWHARAAQAGALEWQFESIKERDGSSGVPIFKNSCLLRQCEYHGIANVNADTQALVRDYISGMGPKTETRFCHSHLSHDSTFKGMRMTIIGESHLGKYFHSPFYKRRELFIAREYFAFHESSRHIKTNFNTLKSKIKKIAKGSKPQSYQLTGAASWDSSTACTITTLFRPAGGDSRYSLTFMHPMQHWKIVQVNLFFSSPPLLVLIHLYLAVWLEQWSEAEGTRPKARTFHYSDTDWVDFRHWINLARVLKFIPISQQNLYNYLLDTAVQYRSTRQAMHDTDDTHSFAQDIQYIDQDLPSVTMKSLLARSSLYSIFQESTEGLDNIIVSYYLLPGIQRWLILLLGFMVGLWHLYSTLACEGGYRGFQQPTLSFKIAPGTKFGTCGRTGSMSLIESVATEESPPTGSLALHPSVDSLFSARCSHLTALPTRRFNPIYNALARFCLWNLLNHYPMTATATTTVASNRLNS
ncbi:uncharacterized protein BDR25DRAFT_391212 [Lindgomyces ingoldianus]|uniref:Uncharacterized protein n=1 Tax=Lindgomyces ingoldianus TaxID=673940 RepID=A0ACB6R9I6_9PLEO|nr:uncharacterized protein BDR25DRAFT_391212 [Lindgomyces ingoldianus]KAF2475710.1 hypothetical protein BDR25DRAFT_391212 [Lindgomyces ingoldianus]